MLTFFRKIWAVGRGYFWLPCPRCGRMFGGNEIGDGIVEYSDGRHSRVTCKWCPAEDIDEDGNVLRRYVVSKHKTLKRIV